MEDLVIRNENGIEITISVIGTFSVPGYNKEYIIYSLCDNDENNEKGKILLGEVIRSDDSVQVLGILDEEKPLVISYYNEIINQLGGNSNE